jgi:hypothetical protein
MKKIISLLLVLVMVFSMTVFASAAGNSFTDIYNSKNEDAIEFLYDLGLVEGYSVTKFGPKKNLTRAEACALIVRALIEDDEIYASAKDNFVDVDDYAWYREWVDTAYRNHIMHGYGNGVFGPEDHVTYAQYATILVNALGYDSLDFEGTWPANVEELAVKLDLYDNVSRHVSDDEITREDAAQMLYNALWCKMVGMRGVTLYDVVTEKYAPKIVSQPGFVTVVDYTKNWVAFTMGTSNVYYCDIEDYDAHIEIGHTDYVTVHFNSDYSEIYGVDFIWCFSPDVNTEEEDFLDAYELRAKGIVTEILRETDDNSPIYCIKIEDNYYSFLMENSDIENGIFNYNEVTHRNMNDTSFTVGVYVELYQNPVNNAYHFDFWNVKPVE